ncbi:MAG: hypothetical protein K9M80_02360 [Candidatus Marinimicrobia bacterium]|nr:hypothetical protein [Candidatus Neomarinimicrobiota bacterium]
MDKNSDGHKESKSDFNKERERLNKQILKLAGKNTKRFFNLDKAVYREGALVARTKELEETLAIALIGGGSITIPHIRKAVDFWYELKE